MQFRPVIIAPDSEAWRLLTELGRVARDVQAASFQHDAAMATGNRRQAEGLAEHIGHRAELAVDLALRVGLEWADSCDLAASGLTLTKGAA